MPVPDIAANLAEVRARIDEAARAADRDPGAVHLVAVSKTHGREAIEAAFAAGQRLFGENRVQEALAKWPDIKIKCPEARLHLIGPLQTNKARGAVALFDVIETLDREKLARVLAKEMAAQDRALPCYVQVNTGEEPQKAGLPPREVDDFVRFCRDEQSLKVEGLMCIPPAEEEPSLHFALLAKIAARNGLSNLSMGMSGDFEVAVAFGASHVRVGTGVFGPRQVWVANS